MKRPSARTLLIAFGLFTVFLVWRFPYRTLRGYIFGEIYKQTQIRVDAEDLAPSFFGWPGVHLYRASIGLPVGRNEELDLFAEQITARIGLGGLLPPVPKVSLSIYNLQKGGNLFVSGSQGNNQISGSITSEALNLAQFLYMGLPEPIQGAMDVSGHFNYDQADLAKTTGEFDLLIKGFKIPAINYQGIVFPAVAWDEVKARLSAKNGMLDIAEGRFGSAKSDIRGTLSGNIRLGRDWMASVLNLVLKIQVSEKYRSDPQAATLVSFLKTFELKTPGEYGLKWSASLREMSTNLIAALPQKAE